MKKHLVLAGGGHAHMVSLAKVARFVEKGYRVTVIGPSEYHYYSGMGPGLLGGTYRPAAVRFATRRVVEKQGGAFVLDAVVSIDPHRRTVRLQSGESVSYDVLSCNIGSQVPRNLVFGDSDGIYSVKPIEGLMAARARILAEGKTRRLCIGVVGGGPSAVEIAGNLHRLTRGPGMQPVRIRVFAHPTILPNHSERIRTRVLASLRGRGIEIFSCGRVNAVTAGLITEHSGGRHGVDLIFLAVGVRPPEVFRTSGMPTGPDGAMAVNAFLQSTAHGNIFGGGDCIYFTPSPLDKVGVYAVRQNPVLYQNLMAALDGRPLKPFAPGGDYLLIFNLGDGTGIFSKHGVLFGGPLAFFLKDYIDRRFMRKFQSLE